MTANTKMTEYWKKVLEIIPVHLYGTLWTERRNSLHILLQETYQAGRAEGYKISRDHASTIAFSFHEWADSDCQDHCDSRIAEEIEGMKLNQSHVSTPNQK